MVLLQSAILRSHQISISRKCLLHTVVLPICKIILALVSEKNFASSVSRVLIATENSKRTGPSDSIMDIFKSPYLFLNNCDDLSFHLYRVSLFCQLQKVAFLFSYTDKVAVLSVIPVGWDFQCAYTSHPHSVRIQFLALLVSFQQFQLHKIQPSCYSHKG